MDRVGVPAPRARRASLGGVRIPSIDVVRGIAMVLVVFAHTSVLVDQRAVPRVPFLLLTRIGGLASVLFTIVSGATLAFFLGSRPDTRAVVARFARRAVFLLVGVHPVIWLVTQPWSPSPLSGLLERSYLTDTIAACLLIAPPLVIALGSRARAALAAGLAVTSVVLKASWPAVGSWALAKELLVGPLSTEPSMVGGCNPLLPWLAIFLTGTLVGDAIVASRRAGDGARALGNRLAKAGGWTAAAGALTLALYKVFHDAVGTRAGAAVLEALRPDRTSTMLPAYVGVALLLVAWAVGRDDRDAEPGRAAWAASVFGRTSLVAFVVQFAVVWSIPTMLGLRGALPLAAVGPAFAGFTAVTWGVSYAYGRARGRVRADEFRRAAFATTGPLAADGPAAVVMRRGAD